MISTPVMTDGPGGVWEVMNACGAAIAAGCALYVTFRDGKRLKSGEAKALSDRVAKAQDTADHWHESPQGKDLRALVDRHDRELIEHAGTLKNVTTKQDLERVEGDIKRVLEKVEGAADGVDRIESILIRRALNPESTR